MAKPKQSGKHRFTATARSVTYESTVQVDGQHRVDTNGTTTTFKVGFVCDKCQAKVQVVRDSKNLTAATLGDFRNVPPPKKSELARAGIPSCSRWKTIHLVMES